MKKQPASKLPSGLLRMPLLRRALSDSRVKLVRRAVDCAWNYEGFATRTVTGFNPAHRSLYIGQLSMIAEWLDDGCKNDRKHNEGDFLAQEILFLMHDYLHAWAYMVIQDEMPELELGTGKITQLSAERFAFCHLLTEAVATVGLDYWYLSTIDYSDYCDLGTNRSTLTVAYHEQNLKEFKKFNPGFKVQDPRFFEKLATFYCTGSFQGFTLSDLKKSAKLAKWLTHELTYGEKQREDTRLWIQHLSQGEVVYAQDRLSSPIKISHDWQRVLIQKVQERLWLLVKEDRDLDLRNPLPKLSQVWKTGVVHQHPNFRFTNLSALTKKECSLELSEVGQIENFEYFSFQFMSGFHFKSIPKDVLPLLKPILENRDVESLRAFFKHVNATPISTNSPELRDVFFIN